MMFDALVAEPANCILEPDMRGSRTLLTAAVSGVPDGGAYQFEITVTDPDGSMSTNIQASEIQAGQSGRQVLGMVAISGGHSRWTARLRIFDTDGMPVCSKRLP